MLHFDLALFLVVYAAATSTVVATSPSQRPRGGWAVQVGVVLTLLAIAVAVASHVQPEKNVVMQWYWSLRQFDRTTTAITLAAVMSGLLTGLGIVAHRESRWTSVATLGLYTAALIGFSGLLMKDTLSTVLPDRSASGSSGSLLVRACDPAFEIEVLADLPLAPTSLTIGPEGDIYVAGYAGVAMQNGVVARVSPNPAAGAAKVTSVASYLNRPHGIAFHGKDLYVSRAGQHAEAQGGRIVQTDTGAVTRLQDLDGDGSFEYHEDVIRGLPGASLPDGLHQNNGIEFDRDGRLYVTVGAASDHGPNVHPYAGTILRANADGSGISVFAEGLRNPYGLAFGPDGQLFCTDNDATVTDLGDEINHVEEGGHYGHPYTSVAGVDIEGARPPMLRCSSAQGLAYAPPGILPSGYDSCLYVASYGNGHVNRVVLTPSGSTYTGSLQFFASVPAVTSVAVSPDGAVYACSYTESKIYRIRPAGGI